MAIKSSLPSGIQDKAFLTPAIISNSQNEIHEHTQATWLIDFLPYFLGISSKVVLIPYS